MFPTLPWSKDSTHARILNLIRSHETVARNQLAKITGLSPSTLTHVVRDLLAENLVLEKGTMPTRKVGRDPVQLVLNRHAHSAIGVQVGDSRIVGVHVNLAGDILVRVEAHTPHNLAPDALGALIKAVAKVINQLRTDHQRGSLLGVGIAVAGIVQQEAKMVFAPNLHEHPFDLRSLLGAELGFDVRIENEANAMLLAEQTKGTLRHHKHALCVNIGLGIGGGILADGQVYSGHDGMAGEIGHIVVQVDGPMCGCGSRGCLEAFSGGRAVANAMENDPDYLETSARILGIGLANAANALNPEVIMLGGSHAHLYEAVMDKLSRSFQRHLLQPNRGTELNGISLSEPEALGAAMIVLNDFFGQPAVPGDTTEKAGVEL